LSKLTRQTMKWFGSTADASSVGVFGSLAAGAPTYSQVISTIQSLAAWGSGWAAEITTVGTQTNCFALEDMNAVCCVLSYGISYLHQMGIPEYDAGTVYYTNSYCQVSGVIYQSLQDTNTNHAPASSPTWWQALQYVDLTTNQTIAGIKTLSSSPIVPTPTTNYQASTKKYVDDKFATIPAIPTTWSYGASGYVNLGGFYVQWGVDNQATKLADVTFPIAFPNACVAVVVTPYNSNPSDANENVAAYNYSKTGFSIHHDTQERPTTWVAFGY
jgi:hypothetical protein